ncbi:hypothetical protein KVV02_008142 [Mortierella alpina]|uniref:Major facilitator superfamily (MFS) profile domain-containing protein n=1 Tax=Mortierella alpina TaxID=64518 RepID=A0A9P8A2P9_MORAP|nr:hypothetical protein KVV02_008142 [Mortierella alpina]
MAQASLSTSLGPDEAVESDTSRTHNVKQQPWYRRLHQSKGLLLFVVSMAQLLDAINISSVNIALPSIRKEVHYEQNQLQWVISAYALTYAGFLLVGGRMGDLFGHRRIFLAGTLWFAIWSLVSGFARDPIFMSIARAIQGVGAGLTIPSALAILTTTFPLGPERTFALSMFGGAGIFGQTLGVLLGGVFDATIGWPWIFYITAIISASISLMGFFVITKTNDKAKTAQTRIDYPGVFLFMIGIVMVVYYLTESVSSGWASAKTLAPFLVGIVLLAIFVVWEWRIDYSIMPFHIWRSRRFYSSVVVIACLAGVYNTMIFFSSLTFQRVLHYSPIITACCYIVHGLGLAVGLYSATRLFPYIRTKIITLIGWALIAASSVLFAQIVPGSTYWQWAFPALILNCIGLAPTWISCQVNATADAANEDQGVVGAVFSVALQIGGPIGLAISTIIQQSFERPSEGVEGEMAGYRAAFYTFGVFSGVGFILSLLLASNQDPPEFSGLAEEEREGLEAIEGGDIAQSHGKEEVGDSVMNSSILSVSTIVIEDDKAMPRSS